MNIQNYHQYLDQVIAIAKAAGEAIMQVYSTDFNVVKKDDNSPLTQADLAAHHVIVAALIKLTPQIPILSEESDAIDYEIRQKWHQYWLIDPLDGTREFVKRNGEFTVNIALIDGQIPVLGVVYAPVTGVLYFASQAHGAFKQVSSHAALPIHTRLLNLKQPIIAGSRSHTDEKMQNFMLNLTASAGVAPELISMGSSLKICLVAEGLADVYPRLGPTSEWDTAAAHCVLTEAGGDIVDEAGLTLRYNSKRSLLNPFFFARSGGVKNWAEYL
jgi:3'(2'), 5'-bisphosphate nucleotidase